MAKREILGLMVCPECGHDAAEVKATKTSGAPYRWCPECEAQYFPRKPAAQARLLAQIGKKEAAPEPAATEEKPAAPAPEAKPKPAAKPAPKAAPKSKEFEAAAVMTAGPQPKKQSAFSQALSALGMTGE